MDAPIASTPDPPYTAVIFTSVRTPDEGGYTSMSARMDRLAREQPGYLGHESVREDTRSITVSYWVDHAAAAAWKLVAEHLVAQGRGRSTWYADYTVRIATVDRAYTRSESVTSDTGARDAAQG